jgi:hypothetical protein
VVGDATSLNGNAPVAGAYCIRLDASISAGTAVVVPETDFLLDGSHSGNATLAWAKGTSGSNFCLVQNSVYVQTGIYDGGTAAAPGDEMAEANQPFYFVVP